MSQISPKDLALIFLRPKQPLFTGRKNVVFDYPTHFLPKRHQKHTSIVAGSLGCSENASQKVVTIADFKEPPPDLSRISKLPRDTNFSVFNQTHLEYASQLIGIFMNASADEFSTTLIYCRDNVNPYLFIYASSVAILHRRNDSNIKNIALQPHVEIFPRLYIEGAAFSHITQEAVLPLEHREPIPIGTSFSADDLDEEHHVAYWREDIGINLHHWHWHLVYPFTAPEKYKDLIVNKSRRGELFAYMHEQILARYNFERLSNRLARVRRFDNFQKPIPEGYFPKLNSSTASRGYPPRQPYSLLKDLKRKFYSFASIDIYDLERWRDQIMDAIHKGYYMKKGDTKITPWDEETGIDVLGNMVEASILSVNKDLYGNLHNSGHEMISCIHDPDHRYQEDFGVMGNNATAMRDPIFYVWHAFIDDIFQKYKATLPPYTPKQLNFDGISVTKIIVQSEHAPENEFNTFWQQNDIDVSGGLDFAVPGPVFVRWTHLQHDSFTYNIEVTNSGAARAGTVRIFLAPEFDEGSSELPFEDQRKLFIELDKFTHMLQPGPNKIQRKSAESNITIPYDQIFKPSSNSFCGCGWPEYMLIPKGNALGFTAQLFVLISDGAEDAVLKKNTSLDSASTCPSVAPSYCGLEREPYPDKKPMGYPFDRPSSAVDLASFVKLAPNMYAQKTIIRFSKETPKWQESAEKPQPGQQPKPSAAAGEQPKPKSISEPSTGHGSSKPGHP